MPAIPGLSSEHRKLDRSWWNKRWLLTLPILLHSFVSPKEPCPRLRYLKTVIFHKCLLWVTGRSPPVAFFLFLWKVPRWHPACGILLLVMGLFIYLFAFSSSFCWQRSRKVTGPQSRRQSRESKHARGGNDDQNKQTFLKHDSELSLPKYSLGISSGTAKSQCQMQKYWVCLVGFKDSL